MHDRLALSLIMAATLALAAGCGDDSGDGSKCSGTGGSGTGGSTGSSDPSGACGDEGDFQVGGTVRFEGDATVEVALQTVADIAGIAAASVDELTATCRSIAEDLGAPSAERKAIAGLDDKVERMAAWCNLAVSAIASTRAAAGGSFSIDFQPPACSLSVGVKSECQGRCEDDECDPKANPPTCEGGALEISCSGSCTALGGSQVGCEGECTGECQGACTAEFGVECSGECDGVCQSIQADGACSGTCEGTCEVTAPSAACGGFCDGSCTASCQATAGSPVLCDGQCDGDFEPLGCEGGDLRGGCETDSICEANCDLEARAKAHCTPAILRVSFQGVADAGAAGRLKTTLERTLGSVTELQARSSNVAPAMGDFVRTIDEDYLADVKSACVPVVLAAAANAERNVAAVAEASTAVVSAAAGG